MRSKLVPGLVIAATSLAVTGCQSTQSVHPFWSSFGKNKSTASSTYAGGPSGPPLPSQQAATTTAPPFTGTAPPASYGPASNSPAANGYNSAPTGYPSTYGTSGGALPYPSTGAQQTNYTNTAPADSYPVNPPPSYPSTQQSGSAAGVPQTGPYGSVYNNPAASATMAGVEASGQASSAGQRYVSDSGREYRNESPSRDSTNNDRYDTGSPYEAPAADATARAERRYERGASAPETRVEYGDQGDSNSRSTQPSATPIADTEADTYADAIPTSRSEYRSERTEEYVPGDTGYKPGRTGFDPPGVPEYQSPAANNAMQPTSQRMERRDPAYRPGGTSDYLPATRRAGSTSGGDRTAVGRGATPASYDAGAGGDLRTAGPGDRISR